MIALLLAFACLFSPTAAAIVADPAAAAAVARTADTPGEDKALKALAAWLKHYRTGKMLLHPKNDWRPVMIDAKDSYATKFGLAPKAGLGDPTWIGDLEVILEHVAKLDTPEAAEGLVEVASIGIDHFDYTREMGPMEVRALGEKFVTKLVAQPARDTVAKAARGELKVDKAHAIATQAAAVRCLGLMQEKPARPAIEQLLGAADPVVRTNAAEALANLGDTEATQALVGALQREQNDMVLQVVAQAVRTLNAQFLPKPGAKKDDAKKEDGKKEADPAAQPKGPPESLRLAVKAAIGALGRASWRADLALVRLLDDFRSAEAVPALITILERFRDHPEEVQSGKLSGLLLHSAHELLVGITGAVFPANQPEKWRELWDKDKDKLAVLEKREATPAAPAGTAASGFCGIPVQGTRVLFILDLSGSMKIPMKGGATTAAGGEPAKGELRRVDYAKRELLRAVDNIAPNAWFNLITFNGNPKSKPWSKDMVQATEKNKERFRKFVAELDADGGTNLWSALEEGLKFKSLVYGERYETNVDELFLLSDGAPTAGEVVDPIEILRLVKECNRFSGLRINTVFISSVDPPNTPPIPWMTITPEELMKRMADQNGGKFVNL